jgi:exo-rhamnogalacturonan lyase-like protein
MLGTPNPAQASQAWHRIPVCLLLLTASAWAQLPTVLEVREILPCAGSGLARVSCTTGHLAGVSRSNDPVTTGIPIADSDRIAGIANLRLQNTGGTQLPAQFRVEGTWSSGKVKWVLVDAQASPAASGVDTSIILCETGVTAGGVVCGGSGGNSSGSNLAEDNAPDSNHITITTGAGTFVIKKANYNVFDGATVGSQLLATTSPGLVVIGPANPGTICGTCATPFASSNDASSTAVIEENGPLKAVIKAEGALKDGSGKVYMRFRTRTFFYKNKSSASVVVALRNADEGASNSFASAFKGFVRYEIQLTPNFTGTNWAFGNDAGITSGDFTNTSPAYLYQGYSVYGESRGDGWGGMSNCTINADNCGVSPISRSATFPYTYAQNGYEIYHAGAAQFTQTDNTKAAPGWGDLTGAGGKGIEVGVKYLTTYWPKSVQFSSSLITVGLLPDQTLWTGTCSITPCTKPYYQSWPQYHMETVLFQFHSSALSSQPDSFNSLQYALQARAMGSTGNAPWTYYNNAKDTAGLRALVFPLLDPVNEEDVYWLNLQHSVNLPAGAPTNPMNGGGWTNRAKINDKRPGAIRGWNWPGGGGSNQSEVPLGYLINQWLPRAYTGSYLYAEAWYKFAMEDALPHSDIKAAGSACGTTFGAEFRWRCHSPQTTDLNNLGAPYLITSTNIGLAGRSWIDGGRNSYDHAHWYGLPTWCMMSGDMFCQETVLQGGVDLYGNLASNNANLSISKGNISPDRGKGHWLAAASRVYGYLKDIGDPTNEAANLLTNIDHMITVEVLNDFCPQGGHTGVILAWNGPCIDPVTKLPISPPGPAAITSGVSLTRGISGIYQCSPTVCGANTGGGSSDVNPIAPSGCVKIGGDDRQECMSRFMESILVGGMSDVLSIVGKTTLNSTDGAHPKLYWEILDRMYGVSNWMDHEPFVLCGQCTRGQLPTPTNTGSSYHAPIVAYSALSWPGLPYAGRTETSYFPYYGIGLYTGHITPAQEIRFYQVYLTVAASQSFNPDSGDDHDSFMTSNVLYYHYHPDASTLTSMLNSSISSCAGSGCTTTNSHCVNCTSATISWTAPANAATSYRVKQYGCTAGSRVCPPVTGRTFTEWVGYEIATPNNPPGCTLNAADPIGCKGAYSSTARGCIPGECSGDPYGTTPWFAADEVVAGGSTTCPPTPPATSCVVAGLDATKIYNFAVKAFVTGTPPPPSVTNTTLR